MKTISLTQGKEALVDDNDYNYLMQWKWHAHKHRSTYYARRNDRSNGQHKSIKMHRLVMQVRDPRIGIDHEDRNGLNNQKHNLRICTNGQNQANRPVRKYATSRYKGVSMDSNIGKWNVTKKWRAQIKKDGKVMSLGYFHTEEEAAKAYDKAAAIHHGEFACLNFK